MNAEDPLFILYTCGTPASPRACVHTTGGYLLYAAMTHRYVFDYHEGDIYWCTADVGWVTGHSYIVYGPLANGATTLMFEGVPTWPDAGRFWAVCEKHKVNIFYTAPTAIRALMGQGHEWVDRSTSRRCASSARSASRSTPRPGTGTTRWWAAAAARSSTPGGRPRPAGIMITPLPGAIPTKPGAATRPFFGVQPAVLDPQSGAEITTTEGEGVLAINDSWPGQMRTICGDHARFVETYFSQYKGYYFTGDGCRRDADGYYWITGRVDDVINVSGHRMGTAEVEIALVAHAKVAEAAVVGYPHAIKGQGIYAYVTLMAGEEYTDELRRSSPQWVRQEIGPIASPDLIQWAPGLPKTRSGKIMRRILSKIAENDYAALGDTSTLADPAVVDDLIGQPHEPGLIRIPASSMVPLLAGRFGSTGFDRRRNRPRLPSRGSRASATAGQPRRHRAVRLRALANRPPPACLGSDQEAARPSPSTRPRRPAPCWRSEPARKCSRPARRRRGHLPRRQHQDWVGSGSMSSTTPSLPADTRVLFPTTPATMDYRMSG